MDSCSSSCSMFLVPKLHLGTHLSAQLHCPVFCFLRPQFLNPQPSTLNPQPSSPSTFLEQKTHEKTFAGESSPGLCACPLALFDIARTLGLFPATETLFN